MLAVRLRYDFLEDLYFFLFLIAVITAQVTIADQAHIF